MIAENDGAGGGKKRKRKKPPKMDAFLAAYEETGNLSKSCELVEMDDMTHYRWLKKFPSYQRRFAKAQVVASRKLEEEARRRAIEGVDEPVFHDGAVCGYKRRYSDTLLIFLMKGLMPERYRERTETQIRSEVYEEKRLVIELPDNGREDRRLEHQRADNGNGHPAD